MSDTPIEQGEQGWSDWQRSPYDEAFYRDRPADDGVGTITNYLSLDYLNALEARLAAVEAERDRADELHRAEHIAWIQANNNAVKFRKRAEQAEARATAAEAERDALAAQAGEQG